MFPFVFSQYNSNGLQPTSDGLQPRLTDHVWGRSAPNMPSVPPVKVPEPSELRYHSTFPPCQLHVPLPVPFDSRNNRSDWVGFAYPVEIRSPRKRAAGRSVRSWSKLKRAFLVQEMHSSSHPRGPNRPSMEKQENDKCNCVFDVSTGQIR